MYLLAIWKLVVPQKIHILLWLLSHNKLMTRDNLRKRHIIKPLDRLFCVEDENIHNLFFDYIVAKAIWPAINEHLGFLEGETTNLLLGFAFLIRILILILFVPLPCGVFRSLGDFQ